MNNKPNIFYTISMGLELGFLIVAPLVGFLLIGLWLDSKFNTLPLFLIIFILLSFAAVFLNIRYLVLPFISKRSEKNNNK